MLLLLPIKILVSGNRMISTQTLHPHKQVSFELPSQKASKLLRISFFLAMLSQLPVYGKWSYITRKPFVFLD